MRKRNRFAVIIAIFTLLIANFAFFAPLPNSFVSATSVKKLTTAKAMAVIEQSTGRLLYSENENEKLAMASTTKIITAIYTIEHTPDLDKVYEIPKEATKISGTSIGLVEGEHLSVRELLYGLMLRSGNDAATALAIITSGSVENFIKEVNAFLPTIGANSTQIKNPHGLTEEGHFTTALDLALITRYAENNLIFNEIVSTKEKKISNEKKSKFSRNLINKNKLLKNYEGADGVKTGFTTKAGRCFVGSATKNGMRVICVLLNCVPMFEECEMLLDKAFNEYSMCHILKKGKEYRTIKINEADTEEIRITSDVDFFYPLSKDEKSKIKLKVESERELDAPIKSGQEIALMSVSLENQLLFSHKIYNISSINNNSYCYYLEKVIDNM